MEETCQQNNQPPAAQLPPGAVGVETLTGGTRVYVSKIHRFGTDALLLARFRRPKRNERAVDLCSGCGIVALEWHDSGHRGPCAAVELSAEASALLTAAAAELPEGEHIQPIRQDLKQYAPPQRGSFDLVACNPPYFTGGFAAADSQRADARHEQQCTLEDVCACAARLLRDGGRFTLCHRPERMAEVFSVLRSHRLEPKRVALVKNSGGGQPWLFLCEAQKNRKVGLRWEPDVCIDTGAALYGPELAEKAR